MDGFKHRRQCADATIPLSPFYLKVHQDHVREDVPARVSVEVGVPVKEGGQDVEVDYRVEVAQLFGQAQVGPNHLHVRVSEHERERESFDACRGQRNGFES